MYIQDVPAGCLVIATRVDDDVIYCLDCAEFDEGEPLTEDDIRNMTEPQCKSCGFDFRRRGHMYHGWMW